VDTQTPLFPANTAPRTAALDEVRGEGPANEILPVLLRAPPAKSGARTPVEDVMYWPLAKATVGRQKPLSEEKRSSSTLQLILAATSQAALGP